MGELKPTTHSHSFASGFWVAWAGQMDCTLNDTPCRALVDAGSTISLVRPGTLPGTKGPRPRGWKPTKLYIATVSTPELQVKDLSKYMLLIAQLITSQGLPTYKTPASPGWIC